MALSEPVTVARRVPSRVRASLGATRLLATSTFRIAALLVAGFVIAAAIVIGALFLQTNALLTGETLRAMQRDQASLAALARAGGLPALQQSIAERTSPDRADGTLLLLIDAGGRRLAGNLGAWPAELDGKPQGGTFHGTDGRAAAGIPLELASGHRLLVARDLSGQTALVDRMRWTYLAAFGLLSLAGLAAGLLASRLLLSRISEITDTGAGIMAGDLSQRIALSGQDDEFDHLAVHLNAMLERIEQLMNGMREVSDNIAHDLKTPLSRLRSRAEAALRAPAGPAHAEGLSRVIEDADALIQTFNALLLIARLEAGAVDRSAETFDMCGLVDDVAELYEPVAEEAGQRLDASCRHPCAVRANRQLISQALANLIDNAIKYGTPPSGRDGVIAIDARADADELRLTVGDRGSGIAAADRERVARRFVRLDQSRSRPGTGLGLSLVAAVARLHGGRMLIEDNAPGLRVVLVLPIAVTADEGTGR